MSILIPKKKRREREENNKEAIVFGSSRCHAIKSCGVFCLASLTLHRASFKKLEEEDGAKFRCLSIPFLKRMKCQIWM